MIHSMQTKVKVLMQPQAILNNGAATIAALDTQGFDWADIYVILGATDVAATVQKLTESDDDSSYSDVTGGSFATGTQPDGVAAALITATDDNKVFCWHVDKRNSHKRYLKPAITVGSATGAFLCVVAVLSRAKNTPDSKTNRGLAQELKV